MAEKQKVATEVAEAEFARFAEALDLDLDEESMDEEDRKAFREQKRIVLHAIGRGALIFGADGEAEFSARDGYNAVKFSDPKGSAIMAGKASMSEVSKTFAMMSKLTGEAVIRFEGMAVRDIKVCTAITVLLLQAR